MNPKISVLLATNRINNNVFPYIKKVQRGCKHIHDKKIFTDEFNRLIKDRVYGIHHFLESTLNSLSNQSFRDFEVIISHRYPEDALDVVRKYDDINLNLVREKHSIWHDLGEQYHTVANNKNSAFIHSQGELIFHTDDLTFFNDDVLQEAWNEYKKNNYITSRTFRCITYNGKHGNSITQKGNMKTEWQKNGWVGQHKPLSLDDNPENNMKETSLIFNNMFWTCGASVSRNEIIGINGYEELLDGSLCGIDMDAGDRLAKISKYKRVASRNYIYEIDDPTPKNMIRNDNMLRRFCHQIGNPRHVKANSWKPNKEQMRKYYIWHIRNHGVCPDKNWDKFMDVPKFKIQDLIDNKEKYSEVIYAR